MPDPRFDDASDAPANDELTCSPAPAASSSRSAPASSPTKAAASTPRPSATGARQLAALAAQGRELLMVSSGAIAEGMKRLGWTPAAQGAARTAGGRRRRPDGPGADVRDPAGDARAAQRTGAADACRPGRPRALPQRPLDPADAARAEGHPGHQRERHRRQRRDQVRRQRHVGRSGGQPGRGRRARHPDRPARPVRGRPAQGPEGALHRRAAPPATRRWSDGRRRRLQHRPGRHDHQGARRQARGRQRRQHRDRLGPRTRRAAAPGRAAKPSARR